MDGMVVFVINDTLLNLYDLFVGKKRNQLWGENFFLRILDALEGP